VRQGNDEKSVPKVPQNVARIKVFLHDFDSSSKPFVPHNYFNFEGSFDLGKHNHTSKEFLWDFLETLTNIKGCPEMKALETMVMIGKTSYVHTVETSKASGSGQTLADDGTPIKFPFETSIPKNLICTHVYEL